MMLADNNLRSSSQRGNQHNRHRLHSAWFQPLMFPWETPRLHSECLDHSGSPWRPHRTCTQLRIKQHCLASRTTQQHSITQPVSTTQKYGPMTCPYNQHCNLLAKQQHTHLRCTPFSNCAVLCMCPSPRLAQVRKHEIEVPFNASTTWAGAVPTCIVSHSTPCVVAHVTSHTCQLRFRCGSACRAAAKLRGIPITHGCGSTFE